jgi:hypothetical protein
MVTKVIMSLLTTGTIGAQSLTITSPKPNAVVHTGETIQVVVQAKPERTFQQIIIIGQDPLGVSQPLSGPPWRFSFQTPASVKPRRYGLTADGYTAPGHGFDSEMVLVDVERPDHPATIKVQNSPIVIPAVGGQEMLGNITGIFGDGKEVDLTESNHVKFTSDDPKIATINGQGILTGMAIGAVKVTVSYNGRSVVVPVRVEQQPRQIVVR